MGAVCRCAVAGDRIAILSRILTPIAMVIGVDGIPRKHSMGRKLWGGEK